MIDDNGDGRGTPASMFRGTRAIASAKDGTPLDGKNASRITLSPAENRLPLSADELQQRAEIDHSVAANVSHDDGIGSEPGTVSDRYPTETLSLIDMHLTVRCEFVFIAAGQDLYAICKHDVVGDVSEAEAASPSYVDAVANARLAHRERALPHG